MNSNRQRYDHELLGSSFAHNAETATVPEPVPLPIVSPCHGAPLDTEHNGLTILCTHENCHNSWYADGTVEHWASGPS